MNREVPLEDIERAVADIAAGRPVVVIDDERRENEGDIVFAAEMASAELMAFTIRYSSGVICVPMAGEVLDRLAIGPMVAVNQDPMRTAFAVSVDAAVGVSTGISAADRAHTTRALAAADSVASDFVRPGHVFPLRARPGGVLARRGHTEAAVDLAVLAGLAPVGALVEVVHDDGTMMRAPALRRFADEHGLSMISIDRLAQYRRRDESVVERVTATRMPLAVGEFTALGYRSVFGGSEHMALVCGDLSAPSPVSVRVHSECLTGDIFGSRRCDCGPQLDESLRRIGVEGRGVLIYLRGHEGRGIGLAAKLAAYRLQDNGRDTVQANLDLGFPADAREYVAAAHILRDLRVGSVRLMTNNPAKVTALTAEGIEVTERVPLCVRANDDNIAYLRTKRERFGHMLDQVAPDLDELAGDSHDDWSPGRHRVSG